MTSEIYKRTDYVNGGFDPHIVVGNSSLMFIGDSPTKYDMQQGHPFQSDGARMLENACYQIGIDYSSATKAVALDYYPTEGNASSCIIGNKKLADKMGAIQWGKVRIEPKAARSFHRLHAFIEEQQPDLIVLFGGIALLGVLGEESITAWRGSICEMILASGKTCIVVPTFNPAALARKRSWTIPFHRDLQRIKEAHFETPEFNFIMEASADVYIEKLEALKGEADTYFNLTGKPLPLAVDIETRARYTTVIGIAWSRRDALVIPLVCVETVNYFTIDEEVEVIKAVRDLLMSPSVDCIGQNFQYDVQYFASNYGFLPRIAYDTMIEAHAQWTKGLSLDLSYLASIYCEWYRAWKGEGKAFHSSFKTREDQITYWKYNAYDLCYTFEIAEALLKHWEEEEPPIRQELIAFQRRMQNIILKPVLRGIRFDKELQAKMLIEAEKVAVGYEKWFQYMIPDEMIGLKTATGKPGAPWWRYSKKLSYFLYKELGVPPVIDRKTKSYTTGGDAPKRVGQSEPILKLVMEKLDEYRSIEQFISLYLTAETSSDGRIRTQYGLAGTDTFRLNSKKDAFDQGMNLQNVTHG